MRGEYLAGRILWVGFSDGESPLNGEWEFSWVISLWVEIFCGGFLQGDLSCDEFL